MGAARTDVADIIDIGNSAASIEAEERRLFYVAVTRAQKVLLLVTEASKESPFIRDALQEFDLASLDWSLLRPAASLEDPKIEIRVHNAWEVRDILMRKGYRFHSAGKYWHRTLPLDTDVSARLAECEWFRRPVVVEVFKDGNLVDERMA